MDKIFRFYRTTIGKKVVVAVTGVMLLGFVVGHMVGNLKAFLGYDASGVHHLDEYAEFLETFGSDVLGPSGFLWLVRVVLFAAVVIHVVTVIGLRARNVRANPGKYQGSNYRASSFASRSMFYGGLFILAFLIYHILHLTLGVVHPSFHEEQVYSNVYTAFQSPLIMGVYIFSMMLVGLHLYHGGWSLFQTLGLDNPDRNRTIRFVVQVGAVVVALGFMSVPIAIFTGVLGAPH